MSIDRCIQTPSSLTAIDDQLLHDRQVRLFVKRDDLINPYISGNKWRKLKYNLEAAVQKKCCTLLTFGGAYSNHILATSLAGQLFGFRTIGVIRGEPHEPLNHCLSFAASRGMELHYLDRATYRQKYSDPFINELKDRYGDFYLIPEGGANDLGVKGCREIIDEIDIPFDFIACSSGTAATLAGLVSAIGERQRAIGFPAMKSGEFLRAEVVKMLRTVDYDFELQTAYHFGGYAKTNGTLIKFMRHFHERHGIRLDFVYTGKAMYGLFDLVSRGRFPAGSTIIFLHTGGVHNAPGETAHSRFPGRTKSGTIR